jgi:type IV pilus assembly protein PilO
MNKYWDAFINFPAKFKYLILAGVCLLLIGAFAYFVGKPKYEEIQRLDGDLQKLRSELQKAEAYAARYDEFKAELRQVELQLKDALKKLPEGKEIPDLLDQINESVIKSGLEISLFQPAGQMPKDFYIEVPIQIQVSGGYHNYAKFADVISKMERIVTLRNISLTPANARGTNLNISCSAVTFTQPPQSAQQ